MDRSTDPGAAPLTLLHDHLDGGLRPATVIELAAHAGVPLPAGITTAGALADWFVVRPGESLAEVFARFDLPIRVMQTTEALSRVAREAAEDVAADGVRSVEFRFAPTHHTAGGLSLDAVVEAVLAGLAGAPPEARVLLCSMRGERRTDEVVDLAGRWHGRGVVGVDLAGVEVGEPVGPHRSAFARARSMGLGVTLHAGEMVGAESVADAIVDDVPVRIGHGFRIVEDCRVRDGEIVDLGPTAAAVLDRRLPLEVCLTSNAALGTPVEQHPFLALARAGFAVTINTDNRTLTPCSLTSELALARRLGATDDELATMRSTAAGARFPDP